jgi:hypothetical protein
MARLINITLLFLVFLIVNCGHDPKLDLSCSGRIKAQDIERFKPCLQGRWKIHYARRGTLWKQLLVNSFVEIKPNDSIYYFSEGSIVAESSALWISDSQPKITFTNWKDDDFTFTVDDFESDTLFLTEDDAQLALTRSLELPTFNCQLFLVEKALAQVRHCIQGSWQLHYRIGGSSGKDKVHYTNETIVNFSADDIIEYIVNGTEDFSANIIWTKTQGLTVPVTYIMSFETSTGFPVSWGVEQVKGDTLVLYDNYPDGYGWVFSRK